MIYYYLLIAVQIFCFYHIYKNGKPFFWYFVIFFLPGIGSLIYIITQVVGSSDVNKVQRELTTILNPTKRVKDAVKRLEFAETYQNRVELADAYFEMNDWANAVIQYEEAVKNEYQKDFYVTSQLIRAHYQLENYGDVVKLAEIVKDHSEFTSAKIEYIYGLALYQLGKTEEAMPHIASVDQRYSNYAERLTLAEFYEQQDKKAEALSLTEEILSEAAHMTPQNKRLHRQTIAKARKFREALQQEKS